METFTFKVNLKRFNEIVDISSPSNHLKIIIWYHNRNKASKFKLNDLKITHLKDNLFYGTCKSNKLTKFDLELFVGDCGDPRANINHLLTLNNLEYMVIGEIC